MHKSAIESMDKQPASCPAVAEVGGGGEVKRGIILRCRTAPCLSPTVRRTGGAAGVLLLLLCAVLCSSTSLWLDPCCSQLGGGVEQGRLQGGSSVVLHQRDLIPFVSFTQLKHLNLWSLSLNLWLSALFFCAQLVLNTCKKKAQLS